LHIKIKSAQKWPHKGGVSFYICLYREIYLKRSLSKTNELISNKFGRKHLWGMGIQVCENQGAGTFWGPERGYNRGNFGYLKTIPLTNHWPKCIDIWNEATLRQGD